MRFSHWPPEEVAGVDEVAGGGGDGGGAPLLSRQGLLQERVKRTCFWQCGWKAMFPKLAIYLEEYCNEDDVKD